MDTTVGLESGDGTKTGNPQISYGRSYLSLSPRYLCLSLSLSLCVCLSLSSFIMDNIVGLESGDWTETGNPQISYGRSYLSLSLAIFVFLSLSLSLCLSLPLSLHYEYYCRFGIWRRDEDW